MYYEWSAAWQGQPITVKAWYRSNLFFRLTEELLIGDLLVDRNNIRGSSGPFIRERLAAPISVADSLSERLCQRIHHLEVSIFTIDKTYCNILLDGELIGGNVDVQLPRTDLDTWTDTRRKGILHFMFNYIQSRILNIVLMVAALTILLFSLPMFVDFTRGTPISWELAQWRLHQATIYLVPLCLFLELLSGFLHWHSWEKVYAQTLGYQRKLNAPPVRLEMDKQDVY